MSYESVKQFLIKHELGDQIQVNEHIGDTVEHAAQVIGCEPAQIAKTMSFLQKEKPILIVMAGDAKVNNRKYKDAFQQKAKMIPGSQVEDLIGHVPGAVCPFAIKNGVEIFLDVSLKRFSTIYTAGGSLNSTVQLTLPELEELTDYTKWVDTCTGWYVNQE
ncbi:MULTISPECIES: YbaK/EbsC family protein [unclassified Enterococcus]|uniref:YbaK/EbsC family protein n=1 Tax=unclassified Enterococcus TaxID=2608891 RepID=UPI0015575F52|nr:MULTISPECIES: YbaK/EbsC family protein [unclassified Enterococcus]MBS7576906.1 YbaK/EbsC family protein [Enterococcus sp. MMGLQ5-2]MBS7584313.1 YbaK/EbsC family protein [Enterococcus sp. MMGLQ5-1]NPD12169.1 YbaK/EbsC family protein [Enterococcus sp. MMGLQ5-1]NPD36741.1 YbaK/EbsC family protein [Enterococcus sp. MMGLQ5-2]